MSIIDDFMSKVVDLNEKEKVETILFLAESLIYENPGVIKRTSDKISLTISEV